MGAILLPGELWCRRVVDWNITACRICQMCVRHTGTDTVSIRLTWYMRPHSHTHTEAMTHSKLSATFRQTSFADSVLAKEIAVVRLIQHCTELPGSERVRQARLRILPVTAFRAHTQLLSLLCAVSLLFFSILVSRWLFSLAEISVRCLLFAVTEKCTVSRSFH